MTDQLETDVRAVLRDIIATAPAADTHPTRPAHTETSWPAALSRGGHGAGRRARCRRFHCDQGATRPDTAPSPDD